MTEEQKEARRLLKKQVKEQQRIDLEKNQKQVSEIRINIEWKKSKNWGYNPNAKAFIIFKDGTYEESSIFKCSGFGYDKESTVISYIFNRYLKYKLWGLIESNERDLTYGIRLNKTNPYFDFAIGTDCYYNISKKIGGKFKKIASGDMFVVYEYIDICHNN